MDNDALYALIPIFGMMIPIVAIIARTVTKMIALREKQLEVQTAATAEKTAQYAAHTERLEQRMRVLERIITDKGLALSDEIESLREKPLN